MRIKVFKYIALFYIVCFLVPPILFAADDTVPFDPADTYSGWADFGVLYTLSDQTASPGLIAIRVINAALVFLGAASSAMIIYAGIIWFFARDNEEQAKKAVEIIKGAVIGLGLLLLSYGISYTIYFIFFYATE